MIDTQYFYNKSQMVGSYWLLLLGEKNNLRVKFKFEPITTIHIRFVVKCCGCSISHFKKSER